MPPSPGATGPFHLDAHEAHSWCVGLDVPIETFAVLYATLAADEQRRSERFRFERDRQLFVVAHGVLRDLLGRYLGTQPDQLRFVHNPFGKPELSPEVGGRLRFSLSHSGNLALIAVAADAAIGIDLEFIPTQGAYAEIARAFFSPAEVDELNAQPSHLYARAFLSCWTKKEAYVKACGGGLAIPLTSFSIPVTTDPAHPPLDFQDASDDSGPGRRWSLHTLQPAPRYIGALAIEGTGWRVRQSHWRSVAAPSTTPAA